MYAAISGVSILGLWSLLAASALVDPLFLPTPMAVGRELVSFVGTGGLWIHLFVSLRRVVVGFGLATIVGTTLGSLSGAFPAVRDLVLPPNSAVRYVPPTAFIGLTIIWFGVGESSKYALIFLAIVFYLVQMTADVVSSVPRRYVDTARTLGAKNSEIFFRVILPMAAPEIAAAVRINLGASWTYLIVAEIVSAQSGLGYLLATSQRYLQTPRLFAVMIVIGTVGYVSDALFGAVVNRLGRWK